MSSQPDQPAQTPKAALPGRKTGLSPAQQKLQAAMEKAAHAKAGTKASHDTSGGSFKAKNSFTKKAAFQRKAT